ncbi:hypothetical protein [Shewanella algae]|uniref:hypothetical protein n=1 Tax=Shewanella algae TaxID=38313 RepID=UPI0031F4E37E
MKTRVKAFFVGGVIVGAFAVVSPAFAMWDKLDFFVGGNVGFFSVDDPDGETASEVSTGVFAGTYYQLSRNSYLKSELFYTGVSPDGSATEIGQDYKAWGLINEYQYQWVYSRQIRPRFGIGGSVFMANATKRYIEDGYGYLGKRFPDDDGVKFGVVVSIENDIELWGQAFVVGLRYQQGISSMSVAGFNVSYKF